MTPHLIRPSLALAIEDAILIGHIAEIDAVLAVIEDDEDFPDELRAGLEALRHFRAHYGRGSGFLPHDDIQKKKAALIETAWGAELLDMLHHSEPKLAKQA